MKQNLTSTSQIPSSKFYFKGRPRRTSQADSVALEASGLTSKTAGNRSPIRLNCVKCAHDAWGPSERRNSPSSAVWIGIWKPLAPSNLRQPPTPAGDSGCGNSWRKSTHEVIGPVYAGCASGIDFPDAPLEVTVLTQTTKLAVQFHAAECQ